MNNQKHGNAELEKAFGEIIVVLVQVALVLFLLFLALIPAAMRYSIERARRNGARELVAWRQCFYIALTVTMILVAILGIPFIFPGYIAYSKAGPEWTRESIISSVLEDLEGKRKGVTKKALSNASAQEAVINEHDELVKEANDNLKYLNDDEYGRESANRIKEDYEKKRAEMAKKAKGLSVGVEKLLRENSHLEKEIAEHRGYLNAIKAGKSVKTPYDNALERFEAYRYSYQAEYIRYWLYFFILIGVGFLCCFPQNEYFFENQGKQKNQTSRFMLFVRLGGMTCFYILWPVVGVLEWLTRKVFNTKTKESSSPFLGSENIVLGPGRSAYLTERNLAYHVQIVGGSGSGKTNLLKLMIEDRVAKGHGVVFFDFKADFEVLKWLSRVCALAGRKFAVISLSGEDYSSAYNPLLIGNPTEICSQIMNSLKWSESFYRDNAERVLMTMLGAFCHIRDTNDEFFHVGHLAHFLHDANYAAFVVKRATEARYPYASRVESLSKELRVQKSKDNLAGLINQLEKIVYSSAGPVVTTLCESHGEICLEDALKGEYVLYLYMNSIKLKETASVMGKMMLQDLMKVVGSIYDATASRSSVSSTVFIDEFASFATPDFIHLLDKARGAGVSIVLAHQSRADLKEVTPNFAERIEENTASKVIFQVQSGDDAEKFSSMIGTYTRYADTEQMSDGFLFGDQATGVKSRREVEAFEVHPNEFKQLGLGEAVLVCRKVDPHFGKIKIARSNEYEDVDSGALPVVLPRFRYLPMCFEKGEREPEGGFQVV